jgi:hypothetical protein
MNTTQTDPWESIDHDPTSAPHTTAHRAPRTTVHSAQITTEDALSLARADIHSALAAAGCTRKQYAQSARDHAVMVLLADDATRAQRVYAANYLHDSHTLAP